MAGGPNASVMPCLECGARAERTYEGVESDVYKCEKGHDFSIDWTRGERPQAPLWPPPKAAAGPAKR